MNANSEVIGEINQICESMPNILDGKGIIIATFTSAIEPGELKEWFVLNNRNILFFDLDDDASGFNIVKKEIHDALFGFLKNTDPESLAQKQENFLKEIKSSRTNRDIDSELDAIKKTENKISNIKDTLSILDNIKIARVRKLSEEDIKGMSNLMKLDASNELIDYGIKVGFDKLTDTDKKILQLLAK